MVLLDGKVSSLLEVDYKVEQVVEKLGETDHKLAAIGKALDEQKDGPLFGEFTTRGVLSTLKVRTLTDALKICCFNYVLIQTELFLLGVQY
jgi:hypothetical protein